MNQTAAQRRALIRDRPTGYFWDGYLPSLKDSLQLADDALHLASDFIPYRYRKAYRVFKKGRDIWKKRGKTPYKRYRRYKPYTPQRSWTKTRMPYRRRYSRRKRYGRKPYRRAKGR